MKSTYAILWLMAVTHAAYTAEIGVGVGAFGNVVDISSESGHTTHLTLLSSDKQDVYTISYRYYTDVLKSSGFYQIGYMQRNEKLPPNIACPEFFRIYSCYMPIPGYQGGNLMAGLGTRLRIGDNLAFSFDAAAYRPFTPQTPSNSLSYSINIDVMVYFK